MTVVAGKSAVIKLAAIISIFALIMGPILIYESEESNVKYSVYLKDFGENGISIWGTIKVDIHNKNDFDISAQNIRVKVYNPDTGDLIYNFFHAGGTIKSDEKFTEDIDFEADIDSIPEHELEVEVSAYVKWGANQGKVVEHKFTIPIEY
jgi:hypothetical protein